MVRTDEDAREQVINGVLGRGHKEYMSNVLRSLGSLDLYKEDPGMADEALTLDDVCDNIFVVGSRTP